MRPAGDRQVASRRIGLLVAAIALLTSYGVWLTAKVADQTSEGSNIGAGFAGLGTVGAVGAFALALVTRVATSQGPARRHQLVLLAAVVLLVAGGSMAIPTACLLDPDCS